METQSETHCLLQTEQLSKVYASGNEKLTVLNDISICLSRGESCAIVGPSGSGKTTLLGLCAGLDHPTSGSVAINGVLLQDLSEEERAQLRREHIGFVFQNFQLIPTLTALENVAVPLELRGDRKARTAAKQLLERVGLEHRLHHYPIQLSAGEQQRVAIARAFINSPLALERWVWRFAWSDSRTNRKKLLLYVSSIILGISALVAVSSLSNSLDQSIKLQAKTLLGADLAISGRQPLADEVEKIIQSIGGIQSRETGFSSMVLFPKSTRSRLAHVRALSGSFPYYGEFKTEPEEAAESFRHGALAIVEDSLLLQYEANVGDRIRIGAKEFTIAGRLKSVPSETFGFSLLAPRIYIPMTYLEQTKLITKGSIARFKVYFRLDDGRNANTLREQFETKLLEHGTRIESFEKRGAKTSSILENLTRFLKLAGFVALFLGSLGTASAIHAYIRQKRETIATLRCIGATAHEAFVVYLIQAIVMGLIGSVVGAVVGISIAATLSSLLREVFPLDVRFIFSLGPVVEGISIGLLTTFLFALLPLLSVRRISPLLSLRMNYDPQGHGVFDPVQFVVISLISLLVVLFSLLHTAQPRHGLSFAAAIGASFLILFIVAKIIVFLAKRFLPEATPYVLRQGLRNLYRPNNQTVMLTVSLGLGTYLFMTLNFSKDMLLEQVSLSAQDNQPNMVLFDIQTDQTAEVREFLEQRNYPVLQQVPIVTMRLKKVRGVEVKELLNDPEHPIPRWTLRREYRSTYRSHGIDSEEVIRGNWISTPVKLTNRVPVSVEEGIAESLQVNLGDELLFDVQGVPVNTVVQSIRKVDWNRVQPNFFVVFPVGILEQAPQFHVLVTRTASSEQSAGLQQAVIGRFPNVLIIDLTLVIQTVETILNKASIVLYCVGLFTVITGYVVLAGALLTTKYHRVRQSALLRTLGASAEQIRTIMISEYFFLGMFAVITGSLLALASSHLLSDNLFDTIFVPELSSVFVPAVCVIALTVVTGLVVNRGSYHRPPLEVLREEL